MLESPVVGGRGETCRRKLACARYLPVHFSDPPRSCHAMKPLSGREAQQLLGNVNCFLTCRSQKQITTEVNGLLILCMQISKTNTRRNGSQRPSHILHVDFQNEQQRMKANQDISRQITTKAHNDNYTQSRARVMSSCVRINPKP